MKEAMKSFLENPPSQGESLLCASLAKAHYRVEHPSSRVCCGEFASSAGLQTVLNLAAALEGLWYAQSSTRRVIQVQRNGTGREGEHVLIVEAGGQPVRPCLQGLELLFRTFYRVLRAGSQGRLIGGTQHLAPAPAKQDWL